jgi:transposase
VWYYLKRAGVIWRSAFLRQWSPDPEYPSKLEHLCACLQEAGQSPGEVELIFMDEAGFYRWPVPARTWAEVAPVPPPSANHTGNDNNSQWRLIGGLNAYTGQVNYLSNYIVGRRQVIAWYQLLSEAYPNAQKIYIAQDNWSIHSHPDVLEALKQYPRIEIVWLPTYSPWLNPIEKLWRWLKVDILKMHRLSQDWKELKHQVDLFLVQFAKGSRQLLQYAGLRGEGKLAQALLCQ